MRRLGVHTSIAGGLQAKRIWQQPVSGKRIYCNAHALWYIKKIPDSYAIPPAVMSGVLIERTAIPVYPQTAYRFIFSTLFAFYP